MFTFATTQSPIIKLWRDGLVFYKNVFSKIWYILLIMMLVAGILQYATALVPMDTLANAKHAFDRDAIFMGLTATVSLMVQFYCIGLIFHRMYSIGSGKDIKLAASMRSVRSKYLSIGTTSLVVFILVLLGILALVIPGIFLAFALMFSIPAVICDDATAFKAIAVSLKLAWGNWWRTFCVMFPMFFIQVLCASVVLLIAHESSWIVKAINMVVFTFLSSIIYAFILVQFNDLKLRARKSNE